MRIILLGCVFLWVGMPTDVAANRRVVAKIRARTHQGAKPKRIRPKRVLHKLRQRTQSTSLADSRSINYRKETASPGLSRMASMQAVRSARKKLGVDFQLNWTSTTNSIRHFEGHPIEVPGGMLRSRGLTLDGLFLILAHEAAHAKGFRREAKADFWAAKKGLRVLWGKDFQPKRALRAAYSALMSQSIDGFKTGVAWNRKLHIDASGYPTPQSRWNLYRRAAYGASMPPVTKRDPAVAPTFLNPLQASQVLGVSEAWLSKRAGEAGGPSRIKTDEGPRYMLSDLEHFQAQQQQ